jgi:hypothetical protein
MSHSTESRLALDTFIGDRRRKCRIRYGVAGFDPERDEYNLVYCTDLRSEANDFLAGRITPGGWSVREDFAHLREFVILTYEDAEIAHAEEYPESLRLWQWHCARKEVAQ